MTENTTPPPNVAHGPRQSARMALYGRSTARSYSDIDIERHNMIDDCIAELLDEYRANNATTTYAVTYAIIEIANVQAELAERDLSDPLTILLLDRRLTVIRTLLEGVTS